MRDGDVANQRPAPSDRLSTEQCQRIIDALTGPQRRAVALTLDDLGDWGTLYGELIRFDPQAGAELPEPIKTVGVYDRKPRAGLPADWVDLFIRLGWLDVVPLASGCTVWKPTRRRRGRTRPVATGPLARPTMTGYGHALSRPSAG